MHKSGLKIILGYLILTATLCAAVKFILQSARTVTEVSQVEQAVNQQRKAASKLLTELFESSTLGETATLKYADDKAVKNYLNALVQTDTALAVMKKVTADTLQRARLDTLEGLIDLKRKAMLNLISTLRSESKRSSGLEREITELRSGRKPIQLDTKVSIPVYEKEEEVIIQRRKKGFFRRLGDAFKKAKDDTLQVSKSTSSALNDSARTQVNISDTVAHILSNVQHNIHIDNQAKQQRVDSRLNQLRFSGAELSRKIALLTEDISRYQQQQILQASQTDHARRTRAAWQVGGWAMLTTVITLILFIWVWRDMSRAHRYRMALEEAKQKAEQLMKRREQLLLSISHDIKAPVNTILGYLSLLPAQTAEKTEISAIDSSAHHLLHLVTALLDYHKLEAGGIKPEPAPVNPNELLHHTAMAFKPLASSKGLAFEYELDETTDILLMTDAFRLRQIVENLLSNAIKYTAEGSVKLSAHINNQELRISISDTGCGLSRFDMERVCTPFIRVKGSEGQEGTGLGLSITQELIRLLGGELYIKSEIGVGSTFSISLPVVKADEETATAEKGNAENGMESSEAPDAPQPSVTYTGNIALLDDDQLQLQLTEAMLHKLLPADAELYTFNDADTFFAWLQAGNRPSLLFTDIEMPGLTGYDILERVRRIEGLNHLPIVATTSHSLIDAAHFRQRGFSEVLFKPFTLPQLAQVLQDNGLSTVDDQSENALPASATGVETETEAESPVSETHRMLAPLLTFADGDAEAEAAIIDQFHKDCQEHFRQFSTAMVQRDKAAVCRIAHKMLPAFTLIGSSAVPALRILEDRRNETEWTEADEVPCQTVIEALTALLTLLH